MKISTAKAVTFAACKKGETSAKTGCTPQEDDKKANGEFKKGGGSILDKKTPKWWPGEPGGKSIKELNPAQRKEWDTFQKHMERTGGMEEESLAAVKEELGSGSIDSIAGGGTPKWWPGEKGGKSISELTEEQRKEWDTFQKFMRKFKGDEERAIDATKEELKASFSLDIQSDVRFKINELVNSRSGAKMSAADVSAVCGDIWFRGTEEQRGSFTGGTKGRGRDERPPGPWWDD